MEKQDFKGGWIIYNSPVEFLVAGTKGNRDGIIIRSDNLKTDLIGFASINNKVDKFYSPLFIKYFFNVKNMYSVESHPTRSINYHKYDNYSNENRDSIYRFCWTGVCSYSELKQIDRTFNDYIEDLLIGVETGNIELLEWSIAPIIFHCSQANENMRRRKLNYTIFFIIYLIMIVTCLIFLEQFITT